MSEVLHIYGQLHWHDEATIAGTRESLAALRDSINEALRKGLSSCDSFVNDGEGYMIIVHLLSEDDAQRMAVPYTDDIASEKNPDAFWP